MLYLLFNFGLGNKVLKRAFPDIVIKIIINAFLRSNTLLLVQLISSKIIKAQQYKKLNSILTFVQHRC